MNVLKAIGFIIIGVFVAYYTYKHPNKTFPTKDFGGYMAGVGFVILGILLLLGKIKI
ncbi:hypothetical protein [Flavobacterium sp. LMO8]|uniref:hypothetical protein n=1 Tax=Flavobacterium sp. LMO8 TaxID=2654244 RepID=UPI001291F215|nr:hypothetical protein [Flavobacterium sp. LMO8]